jgi:ABC-type branched-subunit amino acid transport system substrate-binding protein
VVFALSRSRTIGRDYRRFPTTVGFLPPFGPEGALYARHVVRFSPKTAKIAVLYTLDDDGKDLDAGVKAGLGANRRLLVKELAYDPAASDVASEVAELKASGANTLIALVPADAAVEAVAAAAALGWRPKLYLAGEAAAPATVKRLPQASAAGAMSLVFAKDPSSSAWAADPGAALARQLARRYGGGSASATDSSFVAGLASAYAFVDALEHAGRAPTRARLLAAATHLTEASNPFLLPGISVRTTPAARFPVTQGSLARWQAGRWVPFGGLQPLRP